MLQYDYGNFIGNNTGRRLRRMGRFGNSAGAELEQRRRRPPNGDFTYHAAQRHEAATARLLTPEEVVRRIAAECTYVDGRGGVGIRLDPASAIVRQYGAQFRAPRPRRPRPAKPPPLLWRL